jgi:hypothetical protein
VVGQVELTGFSAYLHPVGDGLLLGVGQDIGPQAGGRGASLVLFDVSDPAKPRILQRSTVSSSYSQAGQDHHAFLWWPATDLAVLPIQQWEQPTFIGAIGFRVTTAAIGEVGRVKHPSQGSDPQRVPPFFERSLVVGDRLLTVSQAGLLASDLGTLHDQAWVPFG